MSESAHDLRSFVHVVQLATAHDPPLPAEILDELRRKADAASELLERLFAAAAD